MSSNPQPGRERPRRLLLCLDGVPHALILKVKERGLFSTFGAPTRLLSPFPTMTNIALSTMLGGTPPAGYESLYFDKKARELRGGVRKYVGRRTPDKLPSSYMDLLDYQEPLPFEFLVYVAPEKVWRADMRRFRDRFRAAPQTRDYFAFLKGTDGLLHIRGAAQLEIALESLDKILKEIQGFCGDDTEIVLFSDHGMNLQDNTRVSLRTHLEKHGFTFSSRLNGGGKTNLAIPAFGLCGYAALYGGDEESRPQIANALADLEGVDFALYLDGEDAVALVGPEGTARIQRRERDGKLSFKYEAQSGDPLSLHGVREELMRAGKLDDQGFAADSVWYEHTADHTYPDALSNLFMSLHSHRVAHTADVLVSFRDGYYYGWSPFAKLVPLRATHGNALRPSSNAFLMSTHRSLPAYVRADDAQPLLRDTPAMRLVP
jgi:hypothetical protein